MAFHFLSHADGLEIHAENFRYSDRSDSGVVFPINLIEDSFNLDVVVGFHLGDASSLRC